MPDTSRAGVHSVRADLHSHSFHSDGTMAPGDVVRRAAEQGVELYALTDHDEVSGLAEAKAAAAERSLAFVPGVEVSVTWGTTTIHVVGLGVDGDDADVARSARARAVGANSTRAGDRCEPGGGRNQRRVRRRAAACRKSANDRPHPLRAISGRARRLPRRARGVQALSGRRQTGLCAASLGDAGRGGRHDRRRGRRGGRRASGALSDRRAGVARAARRISRRRRQGAGSRHEQSHAGRCAPLHQAGA